MRLEVETAEMDGLSDAQSGAFCYWILAPAAAGQAGISNVDATFFPLPLIPAHHAALSFFSPSPGICQLRVVVSQLVAFLANDCDTSLGSPYRPINQSTNQLDLIRHHPSLPLSSEPPID